MAINRYKQLLASVPKGSFYESEGQVLPHRDTPYQLRFSTSAPNRQYSVYLNGNFSSLVNTNSESIALVSVLLDLGTNDIKLVDSITNATTSSTITTRDYATLMAAEAQVLESIDTGIDQVLLDSRIETVSAALIEDTFGQTVGTANNMSYALDTYRELLQELRTAYRHYGATSDGIARVVKSVMQVNPLIYKRTFGPAWVLGKDVLSPSTNTGRTTSYTTDALSSLQGTGAGVTVVQFGNRVGVGSGSIKWTSGSPGNLSWKSPVGTTLSRFGPPVTVASNGQYTLYDAVYTNPIIGELGPYNIVLAANDKLKLNIDGLGDVVVTLTTGSSRTATQVAADINSALSAAYGSLYNSVASSYNSCIMLSTPTDGQMTASIAIGMVTGSADAAQTLFNLPFMRGGLVTSYTAGVTSIQLTSNTDMSVWPAASFNNPLNVIIGRATYQPNGTANASVTMPGAVSAQVVHIDTTTRTLTLTRELATNQPGLALIEVEQQLPYVSSAIVNSRSCTVNVADYTKLPSSTQTSAFTIGGSSLPDGWVLTGASARGPSQYSYFDPNRDMPVRLGAGSTILIPIPDEIVQYAGFNMIFSVWGSAYDTTTTPTTPSLMNLSFDGGASYDRFTPITAGKTCSALHKPKEYIVTAQVWPNASKGYAQLQMSSSGADFVLHRVRITVPGIHSGLHLGDGTIPRSESTAKSGYFMYTWCPDVLSTQENKIIGLDSVTQDHPGHIDNISPAAVWLDKFNVSDGYNVVGAFTDAHFTQGQYENLGLVLRTPARFTYLEPLTFSRQDELVSWDSSTFRYTLAYTSDQGTITSALLQNGIPLEATDWSYLNSTTIVLNTTPDPLSEYRFQYNALVQFVSGTLDLGTSYANYVWFADYDVYTRPEIIPQEVKITTGIQFDATGSAALVETSNQDQTTSTLIQDSGVVQTTVPLSKWSFTDANHLNIDQNTFNPSALYTLTYTAISASPANAGEVFAEIRSAVDVTALSSAIWRPFKPNAVIGSAYRFHQIRLTLSKIRDTRDIRISSVLLKGLNMFGAGGTVPVVRPTVRDDVSLLTPIGVSSIEIL